jgi:hypothetical protein
MRPRIGRLADREHIAVLSGAGPRGCVKGALRYAQFVVQIKVSLASHQSALSATNGCHETAISWRGGCLELALASSMSCLGFQNAALLSFEGSGARQITLAKALGASPQVSANSRSA